jgi:N,N'-diacetyllegionaminate synthase
MSPREFVLDDRRIGPGHPCLVIAEIAQGHDGSLGTAHAYIDAVAKTGADAIKFQTHIAAAESTSSEPFRVRFSPQDDTRYDYWKRMEFSEAQWRGLAEHAAERDLIFLSTPFSLEAVNLLDRIGVPAWKVGSGEVTNRPLIECMGRTGKAIFLSTGMSGWSEVDEAVTNIHRCGGRFAIFQCTTAYPCPADRLGLNLITQIRDRYGCPVGLSDHSGTIFAGLAATALGINMLEVHTVFSRECFGPDVQASITTAELKQLVDGVRFLEEALAHPVDKDAMASELSELRRIFAKSIVVTRNLLPGHRLQEADLELKKPGTGMPASQLPGVIGRKVGREMMAGAVLSENDLQ